jgi:SAM-dependent methyltransferase
MRANAGVLRVAVVDNDITQATPSDRSAAWARAFALLYDSFLWVGERAGMGAHRRELLSRARGRTLEIGAGTGLNLPYYPDGLDELVLLEPDRDMRSRLGRRLTRSRRQARLLDASAERLPFPDGSVDTVVSTFVLCTVEDPDVALWEIARVLHPDGQLLFLEHVRSESPTLARWQELLAGPWRRFAQGCRCNRATAELIMACGLEVEHLRKASWQAMPPIVRPLVAGRAMKTEAVTAETGSLIVNPPRPATTRSGWVNG